MLYTDRELEKIISNIDLDDYTSTGPGVKFQSLYGILTKLLEKYSRHEVLLKILDTYKVKFNQIDYSRIEHYNEIYNSNIKNYLYTQEDLPTLEVHDLDEIPDTRIDDLIIKYHTFISTRAITEAVQINKRDNNRNLLEIYSNCYLGQLAETYCIKELQFEDNNEDFMDIKLNDLNVDCYITKSATDIDKNVLNKINSMIIRHQNPDFKISEYVLVFYIQGNLLKYYRTYKII